MAAKIEWRKQQLNINNRKWQLKASWQQRKAKIESSVISQATVIINKRRNCRK